MCVDSIIVTVLKFDAFTLNTCNELHFLPPSTVFSLALIVCHRDTKTAQRTSSENIQGLGGNPGRVHEPLKDSSEV